MSKAAVPYRVQCSIKYSFLIKSNPVTLTGIAKDILYYYAMAVPQVGTKAGCRKKLTGIDAKQLL